MEEAQRREGGTRPPEGGGTQCRQCSCLHVSQRLSHSRHSRSTVVQTSRVSDTGNISSPLQLGGNFEHPRRQRRAWLASLPNDLQSILLLVMTVTGQRATPPNLFLKHDAIELYGCLPGHLTGTACMSEPPQHATGSARLQSMRMAVAASSCTCVAFVIPQALPRAWWLQWQQCLLQLQLPRRAKTTIARGVTPVARAS